MSQHRAPVRRPDDDSPLSRQTEQQLADELGRLEVLIEPLLDERTALRDEMTRRKLKTLVGRLFRIERSVKSPLSVDVEAIQARMGETWISAFRRPSWRIAFTVTPIVLGDPL